MKSLVNKGMNSRVIFFAAVQIIVAAAFFTRAGYAESVMLEWDPSTDADLAGYRLYYQAGSSTLPLKTAVDVSNATTTTISDLDPASAYYFAVVAYNSDGVESAYSNVLEVAESLPPVVAISSPAAHTAVSGTVSVSASASDNVGVATVQFYLNGQLAATAGTPPYSFQWDTTSLASGSYVIVAKAYDAAGNVGQSQEVEVTVAGDTAPPTVSLAVPATNGSVSGNITVNASAADKTGVTRMEVYDNGVLVSATNENAISYNWNTVLSSNGLHVLYAKAYDAAGNVGESANIAVSVMNDTKAPTVSFLAPTSSYIYGSSVGIGASATDDVAVARMEVYIDGALKFSTTNSSFNIPWNFSIGVHTITVKAYDAANNLQTASKTVNRFL